MLNSVLVYKFKNDSGKMSPRQSGISPYFLGQVKHKAIMFFILHVWWFQSLYVRSAYWQKGIHIVRQCDKSMFCILCLRAKRWQCVWEPVIFLLCPWRATGFLLCLNLVGYCKFRKLFSKCCREHCSWASSEKGQSKTGCIMTRHSCIQIPLW